MRNRTLDLTEYSLISLSPQPPDLSSLSRLGISTNKCINSLPFSPLAVIFSPGLLLGRSHIYEIDTGYTELAGLPILFLRTFAHTMPYD